MNYLFFGYLILLILSLIALIRLFLWILSPILSSISDPPATSYSHKLDSNNDFPSLLRYNSSTTQYEYTAAELYLSLVIPAYNEYQRISIMLDQTIQYCQSRANNNPSFTYELIIVDDGSTDNTHKIVEKYINKYGENSIRLLRLNVNQGKGGAVQQGMLHSRGMHTENHSKFVCIRIEFVWMQLPHTLVNPN